MGERKVLNKYYPPDFDPSKLPKGNRKDGNEMKVRMMLPMSVRCKTCGNFMYKGTKFNTRKEDVLGDTYLGIQVFRFYYRCKKCAAEFTMKTDPKNADYQLEEGATRNYEPWREETAVKVEAAAQKEEEEMGNAMKALENRTLDSKREMDIMAALDEMRTLNSQHAKVTTEQALAALQKAAAVQHIDDDDAIDVAEFYELRKKTLTQRLNSDESDDSDGGAGQGSKNGPSSSNAAPGQASSVTAALAGPAASATAGPGPSSSAAAAAGSSGKQAPKQQAVVKVVVKPKQVAAPKRQPEVDAGGDAKRQKDDAGGEGGTGGGLAGLLGGYGSSGSDSQ